MQPLEALTREAAALPRGGVPRRSSAAEAEVARADADLQRLPLLRRLLRGVPGDDPPAGVRQGRRPLPRQPVPQLRRLPARLPVRAAARIRRERAAGDGRRCACETYADYAWPPALGRALPAQRPDASRWRSRGGLALFLVLALAMNGHAAARAARPATSTRSSRTTCWRLMFGAGVRVRGGRARRSA